MARSTKYKMAAEISLANGKPVLTDIDPDSFDYNKKYNAAMGWAHMMLEPEQIMKSLIQFLNNVQYKSINSFSFLNKANPWEVSMPGKMAWIINGGGTLSDSSIEWLYSKVDPLIEKYNVKAEVIELKPRRRTRVDNADLAFQAIDDLILDGNFDIDGYQTLKVIREEHNLNRAEMGRLVEKLNWALDDLEFDETDKGYELECLFIAQEQVKRAMNNRAERKQRRPKPTDPNKLVRRLKYQEQDIELGITSIDPKKVIGASVLVVYYTKYKRVGVYYADSAEGLTFKGMSVIGFDPQKSFAQILKKPEDVLAWKTSSVKRLEVLSKENKNRRTELNGSINAGVILLKVM